MAKSKKKSKKDIVPKRTEKKTFNISERTQDYIFVGIIIIILFILLKPLVVDGLSPQGVDVVAGKGKTHQMAEYAKESGESALWNPAIFGGMPVYYDHSPKAFSVDNLLQLLSRIFGNVFIYYVFAVFGMYILLRYLKMPPIIAFIGTIMFIFIPHYKSLWLVGHFRKFRALMYLPWIVLCFIYFLDKRTILSMALLAIAFGIQIRTQHYQIVFYTAVLIFAIGIYPLLKDLLEKRYAAFGKATGLLLIALSFAILMSAQPLFLAKEYLPYSKRGKTTIDLNQKADKPESNNGVSLEYATQWSTHPSEVVTWLIPRFLGGMSNEIYSGNEVPQLRNRAIPGYWGKMPMTQSYEYMGAITLILAILGLIYYRKNKLVLSLGFFALFMILLSFGRHLEIFYSIFYYGIPFFNKFRVPMMSVTVTFFVVAIFASYGLKYLYKYSSENIDDEKLKKILYLLGAFVGFGIIMFIVAQTVSYTKTGEPYTGQVLEMIKTIRKEWLISDVIRYIILIFIFGGITIGYLKKKINFYVYALIIAVIIAFDLISIQQRASRDYTDVDKLEVRYFQKTSTDQFLLADSSVYRIFPVGNLFNDNRWAYYHQTIGGYSPIKMYTIEEIIGNNLYNGWDVNLPLNWNVLQILNVKYVVLQGQEPVSNEHLTLVHEDKNDQLFTYRFNQNLNRGWFVGRVIVIKDEYQRLRMLNNKEFDPAIQAILEEDLNNPINVPDSSSVQLTSFTPNEEVYKVYTDQTSLFVISELFYPPGWKIFIDDSEVDKIYKTDHAIQSIIVPEGKHEIVVVFEPDSYYNNIKIAYASVGSLYFIILISLLLDYRKKYLSNK